MKIYTSEDIEQDIKAAEEAEADNATAYALIAIAKLLYNRQYGK